MPISPDANPDSSPGQAPRVPTCNDARLNPTLSPGHAPRASTLNTDTNLAPPCTASGAAMTLSPIQPCSVFGAATTSCQAPPCSTTGASTAFGHVSPFSPHMDHPVSTTTGLSVTQPINVVPESALTVTLPRSSIEAVPPTTEPDPPRTCLQVGIQMPKVYSDGTVHYACSSSSGKLATLKETLSTPTWKVAIE
jgi:hypothetical protein